MKKFLRQHAVLALALLLSFVTAQQSETTSTTAAECGQVIDGEFTLPYGVYEYNLQLAPGDSLKVSVLPTGEDMYYHPNSEKVEEGG